MKKIGLVFCLVLFFSVSFQVNAQWEKLNSVPTNNYLLSVCFTNDQTGWVVGYLGTILKTTNGGENWIVQNSDTNNVLNSVYFLSNQIGWVVGGDNNGSVILKTLNGGENWILQNSLTSNILSSVYFGDTLTGWAVGEFGTILHTTNGGVTFIEDEENNFTQPKEFLLQQNYPNPFNPSTKISWQSPIGSWQILKVYDIIGNEVATLVNEYRDAGSYEIDFNVGRDSSPALASGVYFYRLQVGDFVETKKMILLK